MLNSMPTMYEPPHDETNKVACAPSEDSVAWASTQSDQSSLIRVFAIRMEKAWVLTYPLSAQQRL